VTALFAVTLGIGVVLLLLWLAGASLEETIEGFRGPEERFGVRGRMLPAGLTGFGIAGMSATFAGWAAPLALSAAVAAAAGAGFWALRGGSQA
jgi:hypothetical protein